MPNDWGALGLGGVGRVDIRGATPPIGNVGPGGAEGMGLLALLRRLSMGMDKEPELPAPMSLDPAAERGMAQVLGLEPQMMANDLSGGGGQDQMGIEAMGGQAMPMEPYTPPQQGTMQPGQPEQDTALWEMLRRMGVPY